MGSCDDAYLSVLAEDFDLVRTGGIDAALAQFNLDAIVLPTGGHASTAVITWYQLVSG
jgi:amidase